jgi:hypothetical protein
VFRLCEIMTFSPSAGRKAGQAVGRPTSGLGALAAVEAVGLGRGEGAMAMAKAAAVVGRGGGGEEGGVAAELGFRRSSAAAATSRGFSPLATLPQRATSNGGPSSTFMPYVAA